ncbi:MAG TPA: DUF1345 domain-containing protein [Rhizomicrobium sp.]|nr:DUF1345 domain-containing protein [Rhizomicrobium sp.]
MRGLQSNRHFLLMAVVAGLVCFYAVGPWVPRLITRILIGWDVGVIVFLLSILRFMGRANVERLQQRAIEHEVGDRLVLVAAILASVASIGALVAELSSDKNYPPRAALAISTVVLSWLFVQIVFAMHYAHRYYLRRESGSIRGGLGFSEIGEPDYWDFVHFSIVLGACSQTADIGFTSREMRHIGTLHTLIAFAFNTAVLATMINLAAGLLSYMRVNSIRQLVSQVLPPSGDIACSQCAELAVMFDQMKRVSTGLPLLVSSPMKVPTPSLKLP